MGTRFFAAALALLLFAVAPARAESLPPFAAQDAGGADLSSLSIKTLEGAPVALDAFKGKVVLLNFASTWCVPCYAEMPALDRLHGAMGGKGLAVFSVIVHNGGAAKAKKFAQKTGVGFPVYIEEGSDIMGRLGVSELPASFILDKAGKPRGKVMGAVAWDGPEAQNYFTKLLAE